MGHSKTFSKKLQGAGRTSGPASLVLWKIATILIFSLSALPLPARERDASQYGMGLIVNIPFPESEVTQVVQDVIQNGIIRGTKESGATAVTSTRVFPEWTEGGKVFYKVRLKALGPRNFKDSSDCRTESRSSFRRDEPTQGMGDGLCGVRSWP